jgi:hypothetical protein
MPILGVVLLIIQLCFAYHALKTGRAYWWLFVIMGFPVVGSLLYYFVEVFPNSREARRAERAAQLIARSFDPDKSLRQHIANFEDCGSVDNRLRLAAACIHRRMYRQAAELYRSCLTGVHENDPDIRFGLINALLGGNEFKEALAVAQGLRESNTAHRSAEVRLLAARALEGLGRFDEALAEYRVLADSSVGEEGRWRYGALLVRMGRTAEAGEVFRRMLRHAERMPAQYREAQDQWLALAREHTKAA